LTGSLPDRLDVICLVWLVCLTAIFFFFPASDPVYTMPLFLLACLLPVILKLVRKRQSHLAHVQETAQISRAIYHFNDAGVIVNLGVTEHNEEITVKEIEEETTQK